MNFRYLIVAVWLLAGFLSAESAGAVTLRIVCYNIEADVDGDTAPNASLSTVLEAIGEQDVNGVVQPLDLLALEETTSNTDTVNPIVTSLNSYYGTGTYAMAAFQAGEVGSDPSDGNGPNALIYNATTLTLVNAVGVGTPEGSSNGEYRQVARYELQPLSGTAANAFYVYVSHMKSSADGSESTDENDRNGEAQIVRADSATLPAGSCVLYMGDFNLNGSAEAAYQTMTATGANQGVDPLNNNPQNDEETWDSTTYEGILTESATDLRYRDDIQFVGANVFAGSVSGGLQYLTGSYRAFGNNGSTPLGNSVNSSSNTALNNVSGPITASQALSALTTASDHLPVVADYAIELTADAGALQFSAANYPVDENAGSVLVSVQRAGGSTGAVTVTYANANGTATAGIDYTAISGTLSWIDGDTTAKTFTVPIIDQGLTGGGSRTFSVTLSEPTDGATLGMPSQTTVTIADNDVLAGALQFSAANYPINEDAGTVLVSVQRTGGSSGAVTVAYASADGTAAAAIDYTAVSGTLSWADGDSAAKTFTVPIIDQGLTGGGSRAFTVALSDPTSGATLGTQPQATVTITDNDASAGTLQFSATSYAVNENAGNVQVSVDRTGGSAGAVSVAYGTTDGTAIAGTDYTSADGTLNWASGDTAAKTFTVHIVNRGLTGGGSRTFDVILSDPTSGATLGSPTDAAVTILENDVVSVAAPVITSAAQADARVGSPFAYQITAKNAPASFSASGLPDGVTVDSVTGLISGTPAVDGTFDVTLGATNKSGTGTAPLTLTVVPSTLPVVKIIATVPVTHADGGEPGRFTIERTGDLSSPLIVKYTINGTAKNGVDYKRIPAKETIEAGKADKKILIFPRDVTGPASGERIVRITLSPKDTYTGKTHKAAKVTIRYRR